MCPHSDYTLPCSRDAQVTDTERTMGLLTAEHNSLQQALGMRIKELEEMLARLQKQHSALETRRRLEGEGCATRRVSFLSIPWSILRR